MRIISAFLFVAFLTMSAAAQTLLNEDFSYTAGDSLGAHGWVAHSGLGINPEKVTATGLTYSNYVSSGIGDAASFTTTGEDVNKTWASFPNGITSGTLYYSFLVKLDSAHAAGDYFFHLYKSSTTFTARIFAKKAVNGNIAFGIAKSSIAANIAYSDSIYSAGTTYLLVVKYSIIAGAANDTMALWINPDLNHVESAPTVLERSADKAAADVDTVYGVAIRQGTAANAPAGTIDGIRVTKTWGGLNNNNFPMFSGRVIDFGKISIGTNVTDTITVSNSETTAISVSSVSSSNAVFTVTPTSATIAASDSQKFAIKYTPVAAAVNSGVVVFTSNATSSPDTVAVKGEGVQAGFMASPASINFGNVIINESKKDSLYVKNTGTKILNITTVVSDNNIFAVDPTSAALSAGDSEWFHITFAPTSIGAKTGNIVFTHDAPSSPDTVKVSGTSVRIPPPSIGTITRSDRVPKAGDSVVVSAKVTDLFGLTAVRLIYYVNDLADSVAMTLSDTVYTGKIPGSVNQNGKRIEYRIHAISTSEVDTLTAKTGYFGGISSISLSGLKAEDANLLNLYKGYYAKVAGVVNGPNYQASNLSQYIQDSVGGLNLFKSGAAANAFDLGDSVVVLGKLDQYRGTTEITPDTVAKDIQKTASGKKVTPIDLTISQFNANPELYESRLVRFSGVYKKYSTQSWSSNTSLVMYEGMQSDTVIMYVNSGVDAANASEPVYPIRVTAIAVQFTSSGSATTGPYEIQPRYQTDFETVPAVPMIASPLDGATGIPRRATFKWNSAVNATKYHLQVASDNAFSTIVFDTTLADTTKTLSNPLNATTTYYWRVSAIDTAAASDYSAAASFKTGTGIDAVTRSEGIPKEFAMFQNYPNPFNPSTMIRYDIPKNAYVRVVIYDILGRAVTTLVNGVQTPSRYAVEWNPNGLSSGIYFCRIQAQNQDGSGNFASVKKLLYMK